MRIHPLALLASPVLLTLPSCYQLEVAAQAGYAQVAVNGDFGYLQNSSSTAIQQDVGSAFGLGSSRGAPYARVALDTGVPVLSVSGFQFDDSGTGTLQANFGTITGNVPVTSELSFANVKGAYAFQIPIGPVTISPGLAVDWFDIDLSVRSVLLATTESVSLTGPLPLAFLRTELELGPVNALAEVGYLGATIDGVDASLLDLEAQLQVRPTSWADLFIGYRYLALNAQGVISNDAYDVDLTVSGFMLGGGFRF